MRHLLAAEASTEVLSSALAFLWGSSQQVSEHIRFLREHDGLLGDNTRSHLLKRLRL
jgi:hypothetical protein